MPTLVLDIDETVLVTFQRFKPGLINNQHVLSQKIGKVKRSDNGELIKFCIINPQKLAHLIQSACNIGEIMFLTSGSFDPDLRSELAELLPLSKEIKQKLRKSHFYTPIIEAELFHVENTTIRNMSKNERLKQIIGLFPELSNEHFVILDDSQRQIDSFKDNPNVTAILATTQHPDDTFYNTAIKRMIEHQSAAPIKYSKPSAIQSFFRFFTLKKTSSLSTEHGFSLESSENPQQIASPTVRRSGS